MEARFKSPTKTPVKRPLVPYIGTAMVRQKSSVALDR